MKPGYKLFLYSMNVTPQQCSWLTKLVDKDADNIQIAVIENATDIIEGDTSWQSAFTGMLAVNGYQLEKIDLRKWLGKAEKLEKKLAAKDVIWLGGGHTYYLRWILKESCADRIICKLAEKGTVYAGWSAGAIMAGPTTRFFNEMGDDPSEAPQKISEGLYLTDMVVVPHRDNPDYKKAAVKTNGLLEKAGYTPVLLGDSEVLVINGKEHTII